MHDDDDTPTLLGTPAPRRRRRRHEQYDALVELLDLDVETMTRSEQSLIGKCANELRDVGATRDEIMRRAAIYRRTYTGIALTAPALVKHWSALDRSTAAAQPPEPFSHH